MAGPFTTIANLFRPVQTVQMPQQNPSAAAVTPPAGTSTPVTEPVTVNPLDELTAIWQNDPNVKETVDPLNTPLFNTDVKAINAAAAKIDFIGQLPPDMLQKAMAGGDPQAFMQVLNAVAQRAVATSTQLNAATIEQATTRNNARIQQALPGKLKTIQLETMAPDNQVLAHPASQPLLQLVRSQIQMKNPGLTAQQINTQAENYLVNFGSAVTAPSQEAQATTKAQTGGTDWDAWAGIS